MTTYPKKGLWGRLVWPVLLCAAMWLASCGDIDSKVYRYQAASQDACECVAINIDQGRLMNCKCPAGEGMEKRCMLATYALEAIDLECDAPTPVAD